MASAASFSSSASTATARSISTPTSPASPSFAPSNSFSMSELIPRPRLLLCDDALSGVLGVSRGSEVIGPIRTGRTVATGVVASSPATGGDCSASPAIANNALAVLFLGTVSARGFQPEVLGG